MSYAPHAMNAKFLAVAPNDNEDRIPPLDSLGGARDKLGEIQIRPFEAKQESLSKRREW